MAISSERNSRGTALHRRAFITTLGAAATIRLRSAHAQQAQRKRRIGVLMSNAESDPEVALRVKALEQGLFKLGLSRERNLDIDYHFGVVSPKQVQSAVSEIVGLAPDVILAHTPTTIAALQQATRTIPIVFVQAADPVDVGLVGNLARPEGNVTGFVLFEPSLAGKWVQLLHDVAPQVREVLVLASTNNPGSPGFIRSIQGVAPTFGVTINVATVSDRDGIAHSIATFAGKPNAGLLVLPGPLFPVERELIISLAATHRLPAIYPFKYYALDGGLVSYSSDNIDQWRQAASYVDRILRGAQPRDLPVQLPTRFELVINLKTANALGLTIHRDILLIADEVIE